MAKKISYQILNIATIFIVAMFFSCGNEIKEVQDFLAEKNLPIGAAKNVYLIHTDSGKVKSILTAPVMHDFSNREDHPYTLFPEGMQIVSLMLRAILLFLLQDIPLPLQIPIFQK